MKTNKQILLGYTSYFEAIKVIFKYNLFLYFILPLLFSIILLVSGIWGTLLITGWIDDLLLEWIKPETLTFWGHQYLKGALNGLIYVLAFILFFVLFTFTIGNILLSIMYPIYASLSQKVDLIITGRVYKNTLFELIKNFIKALFLNFVYIFLSLLTSALGLILSFIPVLGLFAPFVVFIIYSYLEGFWFLDYTNERKNFNINDRVRYAWKYKGVACSIGSVFYFCMMIPFVGPFISVWVAPFSVVAATMAMIEIEKNYLYSSINKQSTEKLQ